MSSTRVLIVDDQQIFRVMLRDTLSTGPEIEMIGEATDGQEAITQARLLVPDVVVMDIELGMEPNGIQAGLQIKSHRSATGIVLYSAHNSREFIVDAPGWSYVLKGNVGNIEMLLRAIRGAAWGMVVIDPGVRETEKPKSSIPFNQMTLEQMKVVELVAEGYSNRAIAQELHIVEADVQAYLDVIYHHLGIGSDLMLDPRVMLIRTYSEQARDR